MHIFLIRKYTTAGTVEINLRRQMSHSGAARFNRVCQHTLEPNGKQEQTVPTSVVVNHGRDRSVSNDQWRKKQSESEKERESIVIGHCCQHRPCESLKQSPSAIGNGEYRESKHTNHSSTGANRAADPSLASPVSPARECKLRSEQSPPPNRSINTDTRTENFQCEHFKFHWVMVNFTLFSLHILS